VLDRTFRTFCFCKFRKCSAVEVWKFFGKKWNFWTREIFAKKFGKKFGNLSSEKSSDINWNCIPILKFQKNYVKFEFLSQKTLFLGSKSVEKVWKVRKRVFQTLRNFGNCSIPNFPKITKEWLRKSRKTCSNSKTDSKVRLKVQNAGPYKNELVRLSEWL